MRTIHLTVKNLVILFFVSGIFGLQSIYAQAENQNKKQQLESERIAFITRQLNLTTTEAQQFWPVYNEYQQKREVIQKRRKTFHQQMNKQENLNSKELEALSDEYVELQAEESKLLSQYHQKFKTVLPIQKVVSFYRAEDKFKIYLLQQMQKNKENKDN